jgi:ribosomal protein S18 acetylase RimI-like enzyme
MQLRIAEQADLATVQALAHRIWWDHYPAIISGEQIEYMLQKSYSLEALARQIEEGQVFRLIYPQTAAAGFIAISPQESGHYFLNKFYVDTAQHGSGIGAAAFQLALAEYPDLKEMRLLVNRQNYKSVNFYFKMGFRIEKCLDTHIGEGFVMDDFQMLWQKKG